MAVQTPVTRAANVFSMLIEPMLRMGLAHQEKSTA